MQDYYVKIDLDFLENLSLPLRENLEKILRTSRYQEEYSSYFRLCAYCNEFSLLHVPSERGKPLFCPICGESNPFDKIRISMDKADTLKGLAIYCASGDGTVEDIKNERTLKEQVIVVMATGLEIFFRDIYSSVMNLKYVKIHETLFTRFSNESKNDFINISKTQKRFIRDLQIDFKSIFDKDEIKIINQLFLKRNAIVHNNGYVDSIFLSQSGIDSELGNLIPIEDDDLQKYSFIIWKIVETIGRECDSIVRLEFNNRVIDCLEHDFE